jgi:hypothetical protein
VNKGAKAGIAVAVGITVVILAMGAYILIPSQSPAPGQEPTASPTSTLGPPVASGATTPTPIEGVIEISGNRNGSPVFGDRAGSPVPPGVPDRIPFGTEVLVACKEEDGTGIASVSALYLIVGPEPWAGLYAVSDTFTNGDPLEGGSTLVDPRVPDC